MTHPLTDIARRLRDAGRAAFWRGEGSHAVMTQLADEIEALAAAEARDAPRLPSEQRGERRRVVGAAGGT